MQRDANVLHLKTKLGLRNEDQMLLRIPKLAFGVTTLKGIPFQLLVMDGSTAHLYSELINKKFNTAQRQENERL